MINLLKWLDYSIIFCSLTKEVYLTGFISASNGACHSGQNIFFNIDHTWAEHLNVRTHTLQAVSIDVSRYAKVKWRF